MSFTSVLSAVLDDEPKASDETVAEKVLPNLDRDDLLVLVLKEVKRWRRVSVRLVEHEIAREAQKSRATRRHRSKDNVPDRSWERRPVDLSRFARLRDCQVAVGDGLPMRAGRVTVDQWRERIAMMETQRAGLALTIVAEKEVVSTLEEAGGRRVPGRALRPGGGRGSGVTVCAAWRGRAWRGWARQGEAWLGTGSTPQHKVCTAWHGLASRGEARLGMARDLPTTPETDRRTHTLATRHEQVYGSRSVAPPV